MRNIKSGAPARHFFLDRICLSQSHHHLGCRGLHLLTSLRPSQPFDRVDNSCLMMGEWQLHFAMCYPHPYTPKLIPSQITAFTQNSLPFSGLSLSFISDIKCGRHFDIETLIVFSCWSYKSHQELSDRGPEEIICRERVGL